MAQKNFEILVFKQTHQEKTRFVIEKKGETYCEKEHLSEIAEVIKSNAFQVKGTRLLIDCSPEYEIYMSFGKDPIHNEALTEEEEKELFRLLRSGGGGIAW